MSMVYKREVWKYQISIDSFSFSMPMDAQVVHVAMQDDKPHFWALVSPDAPRDLKWFRVFATGESFEQYQWYYLGTFQLPSGLVGHLCEKALTEMGPERESVVPDTKTSDLHLALAESKDALGRCRDRLRDDPDSRDVVIEGLTAIHWALSEIQSGLR